MNVVYESYSGSPLGDVVAVILLVIVIMVVFALFDKNGW